MEPWQFYAANIFFGGIMGAGAGGVLLVKRGLTNERPARQRPYLIGGAAIGAMLGAGAAWIGVTYPPAPRNILFSDAVVQAAPSLPAQDPADLVEFERLIP